MDSNTNDHTLKRLLGPAEPEVLCDECDSTLDLDELDENTRRELHETLGAR